MTRRDDDEPDVPKGGNAAARLRQFMEARGLAPEEGEGADEEGSGLAGQETGPAGNAGHAEQESAPEPESREDRDEDSSG